MSNLLEVQNVSKNFGSFTALNNVSISVPKGSIYGLLGPNGAGKTTLIRIVNQITMPDSGQVFLDGTPLSGVHIKDIGYLPEERGLYKSMKVGEQALYLAQLKGLSHKEAKARLKYWFERLEIGDWWNKKIQELSKGMAQKIQFVVTVLHQPKLLIFDEPFSGFDPINANLIKDEIYGLAQRGSTIIFSTHRMEQVEEICDHIILMNLGKKILDGTVTDVKQQFKENKFNVQFKGQPTELASPIFTIEHQEKQQLIVKINEGYNSNHVLNYLLQQDVLIERFNEILPSLNDIFIHLVEGSKATTRAFQNN